MSILVDEKVNQLLNHGHRGLLNKRLIGVEKESLRVSPDGGISQLAHPGSLGAALTNPYITTDYSEALLEFITPPSQHIESVLEFLRDSQAYVYQKLQNNEILWATSMPCVVAGESSIPIAQYGSSNAGQMKSIYREGLGHRYGRAMQVIAGVHFNYSLPEEFWPVYKDILQETTQSLIDFQSDQYFAMLRNLQRYGWLIPYLFGASPAVCKSFLGGAETNLQDFDENTYYEPYATSLRMGDIGYQNNKENESGVKACYKNLDEYIKTLQCAIETPYKEYEKMGVKVDGKYKQLNANILQIENEYYSTVRPKQILMGNEKPSLALARRGVKYIELRSLDVNPFTPNGVDETQLYFLKAFLLYCMLLESPPILRNEEKEIAENELNVAHHGRDPDLNINVHGKYLNMREQGIRLCDAMQGCCELLDTGLKSTPHQAALKIQKEKFIDAEKTPSAMMLEEMKKHDEGFFHLSKRLSEKHLEYFSKYKLDKGLEQKFTTMANESILQQKNLESSDTESFDDFLEGYFAQ